MSSSPRYSPCWRFHQDGFISGIADAVSVPLRHVHDGARAYALLGPVQDDDSRERNNEPVLGATLMPLVTEPPAAPDGDALDLVTRLVVQDDVGSPRPLVGLSCRHQHNLDDQWRQELIQIMSGRAPGRRPSGREEQTTVRFLSGQERSTANGGTLTE